MVLVAAGRVVIRKLVALCSPSFRAIAAADSARPADDGPRSNDYKTIWDAAAKDDAKEWIFTGATQESFELSGRGDADRLLSVVRSTTKALNIGCGIGRVDRYLAPKVAELWCVDISGEMIRQARERLVGQSNVHFRELGLSEFLSSFESESFDLVFSLLVLQHMEREDAFRYLEESHRVLKPGGAIYLQFPNFLSSEYSQAFLVGARLSQRSNGRVRTYTETEVRHLIKLAGFEVIDLRFAAGLQSNSEIYVLSRKPVA